MGTLMQEELAQAIVRNRSLPRDKRKNKQQLLESVGYATTTATTRPSRELNAKGVQEYLSKSGLTKELITEALVFDIENKPKRREKELRLGAEILGITEHDSREVNRTLIINITGENAERFGLLTASDSKHRSEGQTPL